MNRFVAGIVAVSFILLFNLLLDSWLPLALIYTLICGIALLWIFRIKDWSIIRFISTSLISGIIIISVSWAIFSVALKTYSPLHPPLIYILAGVVLLILIVLALKYGDTPVIQKPSASDIVAASLILIAGMILTLGSWFGDVSYFRSDAAAEFILIERAYLLGYWEPFKTSLLSSALATTVFPAWIARFSGGNDTIIAMSTMTSLVVVLFLLAGYAFAKQYLTTQYALIYLLIIASSRYIMIDPGSYLRIILAVTCMIALANCYHKERNNRLYALVAFLTIGLVTIHYGTAMLYLALVGLALFIHSEKRLLLASISTVLFFGFIWYGVVISGIPKEPSVLIYIVKFIKNSFASLDTFWVHSEDIANFWVFKNWHFLDRYGVINIIVGWFIQLGIFCSIIYSFFKDRNDVVYLAASGFILFIITLAMPFIPQWYGLMRVLFTVNTIGVVVMLRPCSNNASLLFPLITSALAVIYSIYAIPL